MIILTYTAAILALTAFGVFTVLYLVFILDSLLRGHDLLTSSRARRALIRTIALYKPGAKNFYDLGCARGDLSLAVKKARPDIEIYGIDNSTVRIFFAKLKSKILGRKIDFKRQDIFDVDLSQADIVYTYLWYDLMPLLENKLKNELKKGAVVVTNTSKFSTWQPIYKIATNPKIYKTPDLETLFIYKA